MTMQDVQTTFTTLHKWLTWNEPAISAEDTVILACVGDFVVTEHGNSYFTGWVREIYQDSFGVDWLDIEFYGDSWQVTDPSVIQIIRQ
jgi:hypothetical protein